MTNSEKVIAFIKKHPDDTAQIKGKLFELAVNRNAADLRNFFVRCDKLELFGSRVAYTTLVTLMENGREDIVHSLFETANGNSPLYGILQIGSALASFKNFDIQNGAVNLRNGLFHAFAAEDCDLPDRDLLMKNSFLLETMSWPETNTFAKPQFEIIHPGKPSNSAFSFFAICDPVYFWRFADGFVGGIRGACGNANIFMLLVNPDEDILTKSAGYDGVTAAKTSYSGDCLYEFCSAARFAVAGDVLKITDSPTIFMDVDVALPPECGPVFAEMTCHSVSVRDIGGILPSERISSSIIAARPCEEAFAFWDAAGGFVLANMNREGPVSALSKTALYTAACRGRAMGWDISMRGEDGIGIPDAGSALKIDRLYTLTSISAEGEIALKRRDEKIVNILDKKYKDNNSLLRGIFNDTGKLLDYMRQNGNNSDKCLSALTNFAKSTDVMQLHSLFTQCYRIGLNAPTITCAALYELARRDEDDILASLLDTTKKTNPLSGLFNIGMSFVNCKNFEVKSCGYHLREGLYHCLKNRINFPNLSFIIQNAYLMESVEWPPEGRVSLPPVPEIIHKDMSDDSPYILLTMSSPEYFRAYWDKRIKNIRELCPDIDILICLINPTEDAIMKAASHKGVTVVKALFSGKNISEFFLLNALVLMKELLEIFKKPIVGFEMDSQYPTGTDKIFDFMSRCAFIYAKTDNLYPSLSIDGGASAVSPCDDGISYLNMYMDYARAELTREGPTYLFDQVARYRIVADGIKKGWQMADINEYTGGKFRHYFKDGTDYSYPLEERKKTRSSDDYIFTGMSNDRRCLWTKKPTPNDNSGD
jgi:hypothetical protein